jgi:hypothetical protein
MMENDDKEISKEQEDKDGVVGDLDICNSYIQPRHFLDYGDMTPKPVEGLPVVSENGKTPVVYPTANRDTTTDLNKVLEDCDAILTKNGIGLVPKVERSPLDVKKLHNELKKFLGDNPIKYTGIGSRTLPIIPLEGLEEKDGMLFAIPKTEHANVEPPPPNTQARFDELKKFRAENPNKVFTLDSIPSEFRELSAKDIGGEDMVDKILQLPTLDEMMADMNKNGGFRRGELQVLFAKPRDIYPKTMFGVNASVPKRPDHPWDPLLVENIPHVDLDIAATYEAPIKNEAVISEIGLLPQPFEKQPQTVGNWDYEPGAFYTGEVSSMRYDRAVTPSIGAVYKNLLEKDLIEKDFDKKKE